MEGNYGGADRSNNGNHSFKTPTPKRPTNGFGSQQQSRSQLNGSSIDNEDRNDRSIAKSLSELDPEILAAMEHLSITDEDLLSNNSSNQNDDIYDPSKGKHLVTIQPFEFAYLTHKY
jgi:hypothetical protein